MTRRARCVIRSTSFLICGDGSSGGRFKERNRGSWCWRRVNALAPCGKLWHTHTHAHVYLVFSEFSREASGGYILSENLRGGLSNANWTKSESICCATNSPKHEPSVCRLLVIMLVIIVFRAKCEIVTARNVDDEHRVSRRWHARALRTLII